MEHEQQLDSALMQMKDSIENLRSNTAHQKFVRCHHSCVNAPAPNAEPRGDKQSCQRRIVSNALTGKHCCAVAAGLCYLAGHEWYWDVQRHAAHRHQVPARHQTGQVLA